MLGVEKLYSSLWLSILIVCGHNEWGDGVAALHGGLIYRKFRLDPESPYLEHKMWLLIGRWLEVEGEHKAILGLFDELGEAAQAREGLAGNNTPYLEYIIQEVPVKTPVKIVIQ